MMGAAMQTNLHTPRKSAPLLAVTAREDIEFLVKESELLTGQPGRIFVIAGADRLSQAVAPRLPKAASNTTKRCRIALVSRAASL